MNQKAKARITIEILSGKELGAENTYCSVFLIKEDPQTKSVTEIKNETQKTPIATENGSDPIWNTPVVFRNNLPQKGAVVFRVKSKKSVQTTYLGEASIPFDFANSNAGRLECWLPLHASKGSKQDRFGSIRVTLSLFQSNSPKIEGIPLDENDDQLQGDTEE